MKLSKALVVALSLTLCAQARAQTLVYAVSYAETVGSQRARFPNGTLGATPEQKLAMLRGNRKTEIYSVSMTDGKRTLLFSDEGSDLEIRPTGGSLGAAKAYAHGVQRKWRTTPYPGVYAEPEAMYEIALDGSNQARRLFESPREQASVLLNPANPQAMLAVNGGANDVILIYDTATWNQLQALDITKLEKAHCVACVPSSFGWLADGARLFFTLEMGDADDDSPGPKKPGTYLMSEDGADLGALPPHAGEFQLSGHTRMAEEPPALIAQTPAGDYFFRDLGLRKLPSGSVSRDPEFFVVIAGPNFAFKAQQLIGKPGVGLYYLSPSGKYLAYIENRVVSNYRTEVHWWARDLVSGEEKEILVAPPPNPPGSPEPNVVLTVLGWFDKN